MNRRKFFGAVVAAFLAPSILEQKPVIAGWVPVDLSGNISHEEMNMIMKEFLYCAKQHPEFFNCDDHVKWNEQCDMAIEELQNIAVYPKN